MKINVTCGCGSSFQAPDHMAGQTVRCPACKSPLTVGAPAAAPPEPEVDLSDLTSLDQPSPDSSAHGSTAGRSAMGHSSMGGSRARKADSSKSRAGDSAITQELDDRMTRMYEVYAGKKASFAGAGSGGITKLLIGMGIAFLVVGTAVLVGVKILNKEYGSALNAVAGLSAEESNAVDEPVKADRTQNIDYTHHWNPTGSAGLSGVELKHTQIAIDTDDPTRLTFAVKVVPASRASDKRLSMATSVALYYSEDGEGVFTRADEVTVEGYDSGTGSLTFELFDAEVVKNDVNLVHYRVAGFDSEGKRLFDTPPVAVSLAPEASLASGRISWTPRAADKPMPAMRIGARVDAPGWEDVLLWQIRTDGPITEAVPETPAGLPVVVESAVYQPTGIELDAQGVGRWQMQWVGRELDRAGALSKQVVGIRPEVRGDRLDLRTVPGDQSFSSVSGAWVKNTHAGISRVMNFTPTNGQAQSATVATPPTLTGVSATAYDGRVHVSWDSTALLAGLDRYVGQLQIAVRRIDARGNETLIAELPTDGMGYTDTDVSNGTEVSYEVSLVQTNAGGAAPTVNAAAWVQGHGGLPVLISFPVSTTTARIAPEPLLDRLFVSLGPNELSYADSGPASVAIQQRLAEVLEQAAGVSVVDRAAMRWFASVGAGMRPTQTGLTRFGRPAQVLLRLVDSTGPDGDRLSLWVTDNATGASRRLATTPANEAIEQADVFINALRSYLQPRVPSDMADAPATAPGEVPRLVVVGPIFPVQQPGVYHHGEALTAQLAEAADQAAGELPVVTRRFWIRDTQQNPASPDLAGLDGAVLVVGRAWSADVPQPGVSLRAIDATTGRVVARFESDSMTPEAVGEFADWCASLKTVPAPDILGESPLLLAEVSLAPIHPVWQRHLPNTISSANPGTSVFARASTAEDAAVVSFGLPLPSALSGKQAVVLCDPGDPLYMLRPYVAPQHPLAFDDWTRAYAGYIEADTEAFIAGFEQVRRIQQVDPGDFRPRLILRGEYRFVGDGVIPAGAGGMRVTPTGLNVRTFFPMGVAQQPMIDYRQAHSESFKANPWLMSQAWSKVNPAVSDPFLRGELFGVSDGRYERMEPLTKPAPFATYIAANLLAHRGNREAYNYKQKALALASQALAELTARGGSSLNAEQMQWSTDALLVLIYEKDPGTITQMSDSRFRKQYFKPAPGAQADALRMLVDRAGPAAWEWAQDFDSVDWPSFCWRSYEEMDAAVRSETCPMPEADRVAISRVWQAAEESGEDDETDIAAYSPDPIEPRAN